MAPRTLPVHHPLIQRVEADVFLTPFAPDCMAHECRCVAARGRRLPDACCRYGVDLTLAERDAILAHAPIVSALLRPEWRDRSRWFDLSEPEEDPELGTVIRTAVQGTEEDSGCVFLAHDARGCALHRAALQHGVAPDAVKPLVCRLFPLTFGDRLLGLSDDVAYYSCAEVAGGPAVYRLMRGALAELFGPDLVRELDRAERQVLGRADVRLRVPA